MQSRPSKTFDRIVLHESCVTQGSHARTQRSHCVLAWTSWCGWASEGEARAGGVTRPTGGHRTHMPLAASASVARAAAAVLLERTHTAQSVRTRAP